MKKRYIDFVPARGKMASRPAGKIAVKPTAKPVVKPTAKPVVKPMTEPAKKPVASKKITRKIAAPTDDFEIEELFAERKRPAGVSASKGVQFGVIEEYQPKFVRSAEVKKRPLGADLQREAIAKKVAQKPVQKTTQKPAYRPAPMGQRTTFLNTSKVEKRPLSKNVYAKKPVIVPKEEKQEKPIKIIEKPDKDSKAGLVIAIILTIILGAAAGTVAFLLLPK